MSLIDDFLAKWREYREPGYYEEFDYHWTMTVDLDRCTGCEACVTACQAENNTPIVGEDALARGRHMQWLRVERYWEGEYPNVKMRSIPMFCQQCDSAPCETVCPVSATYHNQDGLNAQVYNRCVGTRSCAVYCPYEVRYFNYNNHHWEAPLDQQLNPGVSVREKGVMEKCTFCIQRIREAKDAAKDDGRRRVQDGESSACVCSILSDAGARVRRSQESGEPGRANDERSASVSRALKNSIQIHPCFI